MVVTLTEIGNFQLSNLEAGKSYFQLPNLHMFNGDTLTKMVILPRTVDAVTLYAGTDANSKLYYMLNGDGSDKNDNFHATSQGGSSRTCSIV